MTGPIDYSIDVQSPFQAAMAGYQAGAAIRDDQAQQQAKAQALMAQQQMQQRLQEDLHGLASNPNPTARDYAALTVKYPHLADQFKQSWGMVSQEQQAHNLNFTGRVFAALSSGRPDVAQREFSNRIEAMRNSGAPEEEIKGQEAWLELIKASPEQARQTGGVLLASVMGPDKFTSTFGTLGAEQRAQDSAPLDRRIKAAEAGVKEAEAGAAPERLATDIANVKDQIADRTRRFNLDQDRLTTETQLKLHEFQGKNGELPEYVAKDVASATTDALAADQSAGRLEGLASEIDKHASQMGTGWKGSLDELVKTGVMNRNEITRLRAEYNRIVTPAAMAAYKRVASGSTSDRDIETAMIGVPKDTDSPELMVSFLRGTAKLQRYDGVLNNAKAEWMASVRNLGKAKQDIEIDGVRVAAGTTFKNFVDEYVDKKVAALTATDNAKAVQGRGYMRFAAPQSAAPQPGGADLRGVLPVTGGL